MREGDDGQWDGAVPLQPPELGWNGLAVQDRCPPTLGENTATCFNYIFYRVVDFSPLSNDAVCQ